MNANSNSLKKMVDVTGIKPVTPCLQSRTIAFNSSFPFSLTTNVHNKSGNLLFVQEDPNRLNTMQFCTARTQDRRQEYVHSKRPAYR
jgi:hypothetical protein